MRRRSLDERLDRIESRLDLIESRLQNVEENHLTRHDTYFAPLSSRIMTIQEKLDDNLEPA